MPDSLFMLLVTGYAIGGLACLALAATGFGGNNRVVSGLIGLASLGYAGYLLLSTGDVMVFPIAVAIPFLAVAGAVRGKLAGPRQA